VDKGEVRVVLGDISNTTFQSRHLRERPLTLSKNKRTLKTGNWCDDQLKAAIEAHDAIVNMRRVALKYNIPYTAFWEHLFGNRMSRDHRTKGIMNDGCDEEEKKLGYWLIGMAKARTRIFSKIIKDEGEQDYHGHGYTILKWHTW